MYEIIVKRSSLFNEMSSLHRDSEKPLDTSRCIIKLNQSLEKSFVKKALNTKFTLALKLVCFIPFLTIEF